MKRLVAWLRTLTCPAGTHEWQRTAVWVPADGHWWASDWTCRVCRLVDDR